jgi:hypothetical protein
MALASPNRVPVKPTMTTAAPGQHAVPSWPQPCSRLQVSVSADSGTIAG